jgi:two-component sensor histidine kinase
VHELRLPLSSRTSAASARRAAEEALRIWDLAHCTDDVLLVVTELVANVIQHADGNGDLLLAVRSDVILIEVADTDPRPPAPVDLDVRRVNGRGLLLVAAVARRWGSRPESWRGHPGKVVWAEIAVHGAP